MAYRSIGTSWTFSGSTCSRSYSFGGLCSTLSLEALKFRGGRCPPVQAMLTKMSSVRILRRRATPASKRELLGGGQCPPLNVSCWFHFALAEKYTDLALCYLEVTQ